jgi:hypothetical protein
LSTTASKLGFEVYVRVEEVREASSRDSARVSFTVQRSPGISMEIAPVCFSDDGKIESGGQTLQSYVANTWYKVALLLDRPSDTYTVWIDDVLLGQNLSAGTTSSPEITPVSYEIEAFSLSQCYNSIKAYFDDVKVFGEGSLVILHIRNISNQPLVPSEDEAVVVSASIVDPDNVDEVLLSFTTGTTWQNVSMNRSENIFNATIPGQPSGTLVQYKIYASDLDGNRMASSAHSYIVCGFAPPKIAAVTWTPQQPSASDTVQVDANVTVGNSWLGVSTVQFSFTDSLNQSWTTTMKHDDDTGFWTVTVPRQSSGTVVHFCLVVWDFVGNQAMKECEYSVSP